MEDSAVKTMARLPQLILAGLISMPLVSGSARAEIVVELVTVGPDHALDTRFGHNLLRVIDTETGADHIYDFGVADFERPGFAIDAAMGRAKFRLRRSPAAALLQGYARRDRSIGAQRLNLTDEQIAELIERLEWNLLPENVDYDYDHIEDNCSTRLRNLLDEVTGQAVQLAAYGTGTFRTYREDILAAGSGRALALIVYDLGTGPRGEQRASGWHLSFLPEQLRGVIAEAENPAVGPGVALVAYETLIHRRSAPPAVGGSARIGRELVVAFGAGLGLLFGITAFATWRESRGARWMARIAGVALFATAALFGALGLALLPVSLHSTGALFAGNQNAWIFFPTDLLLWGPALRWLFSGRATLAAWSRIYIDLRFLMIVIGWTGVVAPQENSAFALAAALTLVGLRMQPLEIARASRVESAARPAPPA